MKHPSRRVWLALATGALLLLALGPGLAIAAGGSVSIVEEDEQYKFQPGNISVAAGETVTWTNNSDAPHTVTADDAAFDSGTFDENETFEQTFDTAGQFAYHCEIHDYMHGTVTVLAAGATPPPTDTVDSTPTSGSGAIPWLSLLAAGAALIILGRLGQRALVARERSQ